LRKEREWWDKWFEDESDLSDFSNFVFDNYPEKMDVIEELTMRRFTGGSQR
jgi:hypothetical protein